MTDKLMYIPNEDTQNYPYCRLQLVVKTFWTLNLNEPANQYSRKVLKVVRQRIRNAILRNKRTDTGHYNRIVKLVKQKFY